MALAQAPRPGLCPGGMNSIPGRSRAPRLSGEVVFYPAGGSEQGLGTKSSIGPAGRCSLWRPQPRPHSALVTLPFPRQDERCLSGTRGLAGPRSRAVPTAPAVAQDGGHGRSPRAGDVSMAPGRGVCAPGDGLLQRDQGTETTVLGTRAVNRPRGRGQQRSGSECDTELFIGALTTR